MVLVHPVITSEKYQFGAKAAANFTFPLTHIHAATSGYLSGIKQWGLIDLNQAKWSYYFPTAFQSKVVSCWTNDCGSGTYALGLDVISTSQFIVYWNNTKYNEHVVFFWGALGY